MAKKGWHPAVEAWARKRREALDDKFKNPCSQCQGSGVQPRELRMDCGCVLNAHPECSANKGECHIFVPGMGWELCGCRARDRWKNAGRGDADA